eukprot:623133-Hanusia_phi.AAC.1
MVGRMTRVTEPEMPFPPCASLSKFVPELPAPDLIIKLSNLYYQVRGRPNQGQVQAVIRGSASGNTI